jgi:hypothetical protein
MFADGHTETLAPYNPVVSLTYLNGTTQPIGVAAVNYRDGSTQSVDRSYTWQAYSDGTTDQCALMRNGSQCGAYSFVTGAYRPLQGGSWGSACASPVAPPARVGLFGKFRR